MKALSRLQNLNLTDCCSLRSLPELPPSMIHLCATNCTSLEKLFNAKAVFSLNLVSISFENCKMLDVESFSEYVHQPMMGVAIRDILGGMLQYISSSHSHGYPESNGHVFYPGSEVPSWFKYQTQGNSVTVNLVDESCNHLVGFVLCCVVHHGPHRTEYSPTRPVRSAKRHPGISCQFGSRYVKQIAKMSSWSSDHVCIWFGEVGYHHRFPDTNVTFNFKSELYDCWEFIDGMLLYNPRQWEVIRCGVFPVYASEILDAFQNVDPDLQFFFDRYHNGCPYYIDQRVFTLDQVKTRVVHKIEEQQKELSLRTFCGISKNIRKRKRGIWESHPSSDRKLVKPWLLQNMEEQQNELSLCAFCGIWKTEEEKEREFWLQEIWPGECCPFSDICSGNTELNVFDESDFDIDKDYVFDESDFDFDKDYVFDESDFDFDFDKAWAISRDVVDRRSLS
ncbi:hypothetical protein PIB30_014937 [Stylosanthes scabra]|uniref:C-JID domain-containing protein n=1 Tax=Stylosanthes scabra TaxID=79078 RepID=A0ABU6W7K7_9FABA|nr:hypothetical protein [Stylosanthes scabra]